MPLVSQTSVYLMQMMRIKVLAAGKEMLLRSDSKGNFLGYIENQGFVDRLAEEEFHSYIKMQEPQMVKIALQLLSYCRHQVSQEVLYSLS